MAKIEVEKRILVGGLGSSDVVTLQALFPASPALPGAYRGQHTNTEVAVAMATLTGNDSGAGVIPDPIPGGVQDKNPDIQVNLNYDSSGVPDVANPPPPGDGSPIGTFVPAIGSPGPGSLDPKAILPPSQTGHVPTASGAGSQKSPSATGPQIAAQSEGGGVNPGNLDKGKSGVSP